MRDVEVEDTEDKYSAVKLNGNPITELRYADDTALLSKTTEGLNELMQNVKKFSQNKNLLLNAKKTKVMDSDKSPASKGAVEGRRGRGRPRRRWTQDISDWLGFSVREASILAQDRDGFRSAVWEATSYKDPP
ncbi:RNA-directed DNA polymerase from mobile element jockey-like protein [Elysia marginata]|uniref:RNA-directed DNA polymerase from mobile element jockey-like protein n=1 Tax=Elysia marginata TaxID=1093978 RepID=A0AAV4EPP0_9GAST|nr:RNA-directed DNA polymerase from mobile element jockey-like protein [Elysia marginata]